MVRREKKRIAIKGLKSVNNNLSPIFEKMEPTSFKGKILCSQGRVDEWSEVASAASSSTSSSSRPQLARYQAREERMHPEHSNVITFLKVESERSPRGYNHLEQKSRVRSEGANFKTMNIQDRQTFLGPLEFTPLLVEELTLTEESDSHKAMDPASQEREAILGPMEFPTPTLDSTSSDDSDWVGRINSIMNPLNTAPATIGKPDSSDNVDWSNAPAVTPTSLPATKVDEEKNSNQAGCTPLGIFKSMFSACYPVEHESKSSTPKLPSWKYEHFLTASDRRREACADPLDFSFLSFQGSTGSDLSYNIADTLDEGTLVTFQQTLQSTFTGTNLSETIVDDGNEPQHSLDSLQLKIQRLSENFLHGLDNVSEKAMPKSSSPRNNSSITPTMSSRPDNLAEPQAVDSLQLKTQRMSESVRYGLDNLAEKTMPTPSDWSSPPEQTKTKSSPPRNTTSGTLAQDWSSRLENFAEQIIPKSSSPRNPASLTPTMATWSSLLENLAEKIMPVSSSSSSPPITTSVTPTNDWSSRRDNLAEMITPLTTPAITRTLVTSTTGEADWSSPAPAAATTNHVHFVKSVGSAIRRRDMDASRLQMEINRLRAKVQIAKMKEQSELSTCNNTASCQDKNRIRREPLLKARRGEKTKTTTTNNASTLYFDQNSRSQSVMIRVPCDRIDE